MLFLEYSAKVHYGFHSCYRKVTATHNDGHHIVNATQIEQFRFCNWAFVPSRDALYQQKSRSPNNILPILKVTQQFDPVPPILLNYRCIFNENERGSPWSTLTWLGTVGYGGGCEDIVLSRGRSYMHEIILRGMNLGIPNIERQKLRVVTLIRIVGQILVAIIVRRPLSFSPA